MKSSANRPALVAVDIGAQSCRVSLLRWKENQPHIETIHRFSNGPVAGEAGLRWDIVRILEGVKTGLAKCAEVAAEGVAGIAVDGWAVDYVRLKRDGKHLADPFCYRDERTILSERMVHKIISPEKLYSLTGIQLLRINTLYQLHADGLAGVEPGLPWLNLPEFILHQLGGRPVAEYTNATHSQLVKLGSHEWCTEVFKAAALNPGAAPEIVPTGTILGKLGGELGELAAFREAKLIAPACHDTASAVAGIPATGEDWAFISSGTWSLVGTVLKRPCVTEEALRMNFTNLGGVGNSICFLKNVNGMWLLQQCMEEWNACGYSWSVEELLERCVAEPVPQTLIDVDDPPMMLPGNMLGKINEQLVKTGGRPFSGENADVPAVAATIFHSLAARYAEVLGSVVQITGKKLKRLYIVGGGSQNRFLNRLTAECSGLEVIAGPVESTTIGNFAIQMAALDGDGDDATGVTGASVAKWAGEIARWPARSANPNAD
jgi:rhamnulokinase